MQTNHHNGEKPAFMLRIEAAVAALKQGGMVILCDDPDRENEGDVVCAGQFCGPQQINFMKTHARGLICVPMLPSRLEDLQLPLQAEYNTSQFNTAFTVMVDATHGITTGISAGDMAHTIKVLCDPATHARDLVRPGHIPALRYREGGVLKRHGQTEGSVDLLKIAGLTQVAVICEVCNEDGSMARQTELHKFSELHDIPIVHVADIVRYRLREESLIRFISQAKLPTRMGDFTIHGYEVPLTGEHHVALVMGDPSQEDSVVCRVHSECLTGDTFHSARCDCGDQLEYALSRIAEEGVGVLLYLRQEGRGIGLINKLRAYELQDGGMDTVDANLALGLPADNRDYGVGAQILRDLGVSKLRIMTNNPTKLVGLEAYGIQIVERVSIPLTGAHSEAGHKYMRTKVERMGHMIDTSGME